MEYTLYLLLAVCGLIFFVNLFLSRKRTSRRKSRKFMDRYRAKEGKE